MTGENERCIELPLGHEVMAIAQPGWVLDAGCAMNRRLPEGGQARVLHLTQDVASEKAALSEGKRSYVCADLRNLSLFADRAFDRVVCISTLEHVGHDNTAYAAPAEDDPDSVWAAIDELVRVTRYTLLITVPFHHIFARSPKWRYFTPTDVAQIVDTALAAGLDPEARYYARNDTGWYGGDLEPVPASTDQFPERVNAIVAVRCLRRE